MYDDLERVRLFKFGVYAFSEFRFSFRWCSYTDHYVTDAEFGALPPRLQEQVKRTAMHNLSQAAGWPQQMYYTPAAPPNRYKRVGAFGFFSSHLHTEFHRVCYATDWLRERIFFEGLKLNGSYTTQRLGFKAPNVFIMSLVP